MVVFPLLYDKVFKRFNVDPPRGVLFYGPPGTGKTLVARALANECSHGDKRVAFFMRKGADCLSKWVGESERQLRLLFDQAYKYRPSIIFFDEIDGLAPVRSSRQDQIHSSIVSTLLALMDGLDNRGEIVVIGATNRIDSLDPALRRPGRFDREFLFPLPSFEARKHILKIQTSKWNPRLNDTFITELAEKCVGYCGADLKSLCTETAMLALRRRYPQIYMSNDALQLDESSINVCAKDFFNAMKNIIPTSRRSVNAPGRPLSLQVLPLMNKQLNRALNQLSNTFPPCLQKSSSSSHARSVKIPETEMIWEELASDEEEDAPSIFVSSCKNNKYQQKKSLDAASTSKQSQLFLNYSSFSTLQPWIFRPRIILTGHLGQGQTSYIAPAMIHHMEELPVHVLDLPSLYAVTAKTPEESCANVFHEAKRKCPSIIYMPYINQWWNVLGDTLQTTLHTLIQDLDPSSSLLLLATSEQPYTTLDPKLQSLFSENSGEVLKMSNPNSDERKEYFKELLLHHSCKAPPEKKDIAKRLMETLPKAAPAAPKELTKKEMDSLMEKEELTLMELRIFLRDVLHKLGSDKKFTIFTKAVDIDDAPDYYEVIENPMDLSTMMSKIDCHEYNKVRSFMDDIDLICSNALEYNPNRGPMDRVIRHRACALKDTAYAIIKTELDKDFEKMCVEIEQSRKRRGIKSTTVPDFIRTKPSIQNGPSSSRSACIPSYLDSNRPPRSIPKPEGERFSRRVRGLIIDPIPSLEDVEKIARSNHANDSTFKEDKNESTLNTSQVKNVSYEKGSTPVGVEPNADKNNCANESIESIAEREPESQTDSLQKKGKRPKCVWCRPKRRRKYARIPKKMLHKAAAQFVLKKKGRKPTLPPSTSQTLSIDISVQNESEELKSPVRKSSRLLSPSNSPGAVNTCEPSLNPNCADTVNLSVCSSQSQPSQTNIAVNESNEKEFSLLKTAHTEDSKCEKENDTGTIKLLESTMEKSQDLEETLESRKTQVVKRLDLDFAVVDSGAGSSLDGNGDSRDSTDNKMDEANTATVISDQVKDLNENNSLYSSEKASNVLSQPSEKFVIPAERLTVLLDRLVAVTHDYNVESLEKIYSQLSQIIYRHKQLYDRSGMVMELERKVAEMTKREHCQISSLSN